MHQGLIASWTLLHLTQPFPASCNTKMQKLMYKRTPPGEMMETGQDLLITDLPLNAEDLCKIHSSTSGQAFLVG
jgi:hypothetical protein